MQIYSLVDHYLLITEKNLIENIVLVSPCESFQELSEADRSEGFRGKKKKNENFNPNTWYRFTGNAGTVMPTSCVPEGHCGTEAPGWLVLDEMPKPNRYERSATVCFHADGKCCKCKTEIAVKNCGKFFVYKLSPPRADVVAKCGGDKRGRKKMRYCAADRVGEFVQARCFWILSDVCLFVC